MQQKIQQLLKFASQPNPQFITEEKSIYSLQHKLNQTPLTLNEIDFLNQQFGDLAPSIIEFYSKINGADLFVGTNHNLEMHNTFSFNLTPVNKMANVTEGFLEWFDDVDLEDEAYEHHGEIGISFEGTPPWWSFEEDTALVLAEYEYSAEYIYIVLRGEQRGAVYNFFHDGSWHNIIARNFNEFLDGLMDEPLKVVGPYMNSFFAYKGGKIIEYKTD